MYMFLSEPRTERVFERSKRPYNRLLRYAACAARTLTEAASPPVTALRCAAQPPVSSSSLTTGCVGRVLTVR